MTASVLVMVSPFYNGMPWKDIPTGVVFEKEDIPVRLDKTMNLIGVKNSVRLNHLLLLEGTLDDVVATNADTNPAELTKADLAELVASADGEALIAAQADLAIAEGALATAQADLATAQADLATAEGTLATTQADLATAEGTLATTQADLTTAQGNLTTATNSLTTTKTKFFTLHTFTETDLEDAYFTVAILKEIMDAKAIAYAPEAIKADLQATLLAGQV